MRNIMILFGALSIMLACSEQDYTSGNQAQLPIIISGSYPSVSVTRAAIDGGFVAGDATGLFIVDYDADGQAGEVLMRGNRASNLKFTLQENGQWQAATQLYWADPQTPADFYAYYPFDASMSSVMSYAFSVLANQADNDKSSGMAGYTASDLLLARAQKVQPTAETVNLSYKHLMAGVNVSLQKGIGFTDAEWAAFDKTVLLGNTILSGTVNLTDGTLSVGNGSVQSIVPLAHNGEWRAVVFPQTVAAGKNIVSVTIDGQGYQLGNTAGMTFLSGKMHQFTIEVNRSAATGQFEFELIGEAITTWQEDTELHEGLVRDYLLVSVEQAGTLRKCIQELGYDVASVTSMKVAGNLNRHDLTLMGDSMPTLINLNLKDARIVADENGEGEGVLSFRRNPEWQSYSLLTHLILPDRITRIEEGAFAFCRLQGSLNIPDGVETIGAMAFFDCSFTGSLTLPSTLKRIEGSAFSFNSFTGELNLPEKLEYIADSDYPVFTGSAFTGTLLIPTMLEGLVPINCSKMYGTLYIPQGIKVIPGICFAESGFSEVVLPEGITEIRGGAFRNSNLSGELVLPSTLTSLGGHAFGGSKITKVIFPDNLKVMEDGAYYFEGIFANCDRLMGTLEFPKNVIRVPKGCFYNCTALEGVVFSEHVAIIDEQAFASCAMLNSIVCENPEPPVICADAFLGVPKDNFTVEVPKGSVEKYKNAKGWSDFKRISEHSGFVCRPAQVQALNALHVEELVVNADAEWTVSSKPDWVTLSVTSGTGKATVKVTFQQLSHGAGNRQGDIVFQMQQNGKSYETKCAVSQYDYEYEEDGSLKLQTATKGNNGGIDIVFVGDGWNGQTISDGSYLDLVKYQTECFFAIEPYRSMREYFNVYVTFPLSQENGVNTMYTYVNNHFGTLQGESSLSVSCTSAQLITETDRVVDYVVEKTPVTNSRLDRTLMVLVPNATGYEGNTLFMQSGAALSICPPSDNAYPRDTRGTIQHEAGGHGFGKLADEAIKSGRCGYGFIPEGKASEIREMHWRGWYQNLSLSGKLSDVAWAEFIFDPAYSDNVDVYEGGYGYMRGVYRPESNSCMNYGIPYYNTPSRLAIWKRIKDYAGETWTMDEFRAQDTFEWGTTNVTRSVAQIGSGQGYAESNRHVEPRIMDFKKMGSEVRRVREQLKSRMIKK